MLELLSDADTAASTITTLGRWLINGRRWRGILEIGAWHGATTCGLFQQKSFRIDAQITFGLNRDWQHHVVAVDNFLPDGPPQAEPHAYHTKPKAYWQLLCNLLNAPNASAWTVGDCPRHPQERI